MVWKGGKWYVRKRMPPVRPLLLKGLAGGAVVAGVVLLARRVMG
jgi:hypothetical protein